MRSTIGRPGPKRRQVLEIGLGAAGALAIPVRAPKPGWAAAAGQHAAIGTWPAGAQGNSVFVGVTTPLTGPYSGDGADHKLGYELAFEQINEGGPIAAKWGLKGKGVLGKQIRYQIADTETKPNIAVQAQTMFITDKAIMITGCVASSTAVALEELAQREKVLNMVGASGSNATTGKDCQRYAFRSQPSAYMVSQALAPVLAKQMGKGLKVAYLVPDYTYGHSLFDSISAGGKKYGWTVVSQQVVPLGTSDFSAALLNIVNSGADLFVNIAFGADAVASTKQAGQFGVLKKMKMTAPNISAFQAKEVGNGLMAGVYGTMDFWWTLEDRYPLAKDFVQAFYKVNRYYPRWDAHIGYMQTFIWALAVERAKTFYPPAVIKVLEASKSDPFDSTLGKVWYRAEDHQLVRPVPVLLGKAPSAMKNPEDFYEVVEVVPGEHLVPPPGMFSCHLGAYT
jgi:ABC-type branched-subunit amino acid transport system substrate-binding protein